MRGEKNTGPNVANWSQWRAEFAEAGLAYIFCLQVRSRRRYILHCNIPLMFFINLRMLRTWMFPPKHSGRAFGHGLFFEVR